MKFKGTKGKWQTCERTNHVQTAPSESREIRMLQTICSVNSTFISEEEFNANQLLISKAPEMLEMLKHILALAECGNIVEAYKVEELIKSATELKS